MSETVFEPQIVGFLCRWCSYPGADLAGTSRLAYSPSLRVIRVPCSGRVDPLFVLKAFQEGADGVMVLGCHPGDCHYLQGNYHAQRRFALMHRLLEYVGIEYERLLVDWVSAAEGRRFAQMVSEFALQVRDLGPLILNAVPVLPVPHSDAPHSDALHSDAASEWGDIGMAAPPAPGARGGSQ